MQSHSPFSGAGLVGCDVFALKDGAFYAVLLAVVSTMGGGGVWDGLCRQRELTLPVSTLGRVEDLRNLEVSASTATSSASQA